MGNGVNLRLCDDCKYWELSSGDKPCSMCLFKSTHPMWESKEICEDIGGCNQLWKMGLEDSVSSFNIVGQAKEVSSFDIVDKPQHYCNSNIEPIDYMEDKLSPSGFEGYCIGNVIKYVSRYQHKNGVQDLQKAKWYLNKIIEYLEK